MSSLARATLVRALAVGIVGSCLFAGAAAADEEPEEETREELDRRDPFDWYVLPNTETSSDRGIGGGLLGLFYWYEPGVLPYSNKIEAGAIITSKLYQTHYLIWERLGLLQGKLRLRVKLGFIATQDDNFCGFGNEVSCDVADAEAAAMDRGLAPGTGEFDEFVKRYYHVRAMRPALETLVRWKPERDIEGLELSIKTRAYYEISGFLGEAGPYPGSLFDERFGDGQEGWVQVIEGGVLIDRRDNELKPNNGWLVGGYARTGVRLTPGIDDKYIGGTLVGARYLTLPGGLVSANRAIFDLIGGQASARERSFVNGVWPSTAFGGTIGRGIRNGRFIGKIKATAQSELRWGAWRPTRKLTFLTNAFVDAGWIGAGWSDFGGDPTRILTSFGGGLGMSYGRSFVGRLDLGLSGAEDFSPFFYLSLGELVLTIP